MRSLCVINVQGCVFLIGMELIRIIHIIRWKLVTPCDVIDLG